VTLWVVVRYFDWSDMEAGPLKVRVGERCGQGFAPVFANLDDALRLYPDSQILRLVVGEKEAEVNVGAD
jgi:hypothetical protein